MGQFRSKQKGKRTRRTDALTLERQRLLEALQGRSRPTTERELAAELAAPPSENRSVDEVHCRLRHVGLPKLSDAGLVDWDRTDAIVRAVDDTASRDEESRDAVESSNTDAIDGGHSGRRNRILTLLEGQEGPKDRAALAYEVAVREHGGAITSEAVDEIETALHHVHLPKLADAGHVDYEADSGTISPRQ